MTIKTPTIKTPPRLTVVPKLRRDRNTLVMYPHGAARFAGWLLHFGANRLCRDVDEVRISPKATAVMSCLLASPNQVIARDALIDTVWADSDVGEEVLTQVIAELRRALGGANGPGQLIETVRKGGYMLRAEVVPHDGELPRPRAETAAKEDGRPRDDAHAGVPGIMHPRRRCWRDQRLHPVDRHCRARSH